MPSRKSLVLLGASMIGCYHYVPVAGSSLVSGTPVTVNVSQSGSMKLASHLGNNVSVLDGTVVKASQEEIILSLNAIRRRGELQPSSWAGENITLAAEDVADVDERTLSRGRTFLASSALVAGATVVVIAIAKATGSASGGGGQRPTPNPVVIR